jgi:AraC family transcriptional regulator
MTLPSADKFTFASDDMWLSEFRLSPTHPDWRLTRQTTADAFLVAFPRTTVAIRQEHTHEVVADPLSAVIYNPGQAYRRRLISSVGDDCTIVAARPELVAQIAAEFDPRADRRSYRVPFAASTVERAGHEMAERVRRAARRDVATPEELREELYWLLRHVIASGYHDQPSARRSRTTEAHRELAAAIRADIGRDLTASRSLDDMARDVAVSPFHLIRVFRSITGRSVHAYRTELRLRSSLPLIAAGERLADVAQQLGFASHAHLTDRFARAYGVSPMRWRETSKNMEAPAGRTFIA